MLTFRAYISAHLKPSYCSVGGKRSAEHPLQDDASHVSSKGPVIFLQDDLRWDTAKDGLGKHAGRGAGLSLSCRKTEPLRASLCLTGGGLTGASLPHRSGCGCCSPLGSGLCCCGNWGSSLPGACGCCTAAKEGAGNT